jgi:hypothetical protein
MTQSPDPVDSFHMLRADPNDPPNIRLLRLAVIGMGVVLVLGFAAVVGRVVYLTTRTSAVPAVTSSASGAPVQTASGPIAGDVRLALPPGAKVVSQSLAGNRLAVHYAGVAGEGIIILDLETGRPVSQVRIEPATK